MPASKSSAWRNSSCRRGFCAPLLGWPLRPQTFPQGEPPPADHLCKRELTTNKWLWVQEILGPCQGGLAGGHSHTQRPPVKGSSRGTRWMLMRFSGLGFLLTRNEGKKPRRWGAVISGVRKTLSNVWIKGAGRWKQRSHEGDCCYGVLTPKNNFIQLVVFLRLCLATHDRAGRTKTGLYRGLYFIVMKYWLRQEGKDWGEGSRLSSTSRGHRTFVQRLRSSLPVCEQAHHSRIAGDCPQAYGLGAGDGHPLGMPPPTMCGLRGTDCQSWQPLKRRPWKGPAQATELSWEGKVNLRPSYYYSTLVSSGNWTGPRCLWLLGTGKWRRQTLWHRPHLALLIHRQRQEPVLLSFTSLPPRVQGEWNKHGDRSNLSSTGTSLRKPDLGLCSNSGTLQALTDRLPGA